MEKSDITVSPSTFTSSENQTTSPQFPVDNFNGIFSERKIAYAVVPPVGLFFNTFSICVLLTSKSLRAKTTGRLLIALAVSDNIYLLGKIFLIAL